MRATRRLGIVTPIATLGFAVAMVGLGVVADRATAASAKQADKAGWSFVTESNKRIVLAYAAAKDTPRVLTFACARESEGFEIVLDGVKGGRSNVSGVKLTLTNGPATYVATGEIGFFTGALSFDSTLIADAKTLRQLRDTLLPVLEGSGPIVLTLGSQTRELPVAGIAEPLKQFKKTCFGA